LPPLSKHSFILKNSCYYQIIKLKKMKKLNHQLLPIAILLLFVSLWNTSCKKDIVIPPGSENPYKMSDEKRSDGFAENDMVMYWNDKTRIVLTGPFTPPAQSRYFAMVQIAVHDALNAIKPKYKSYALLNERSQFANIDAAVASAAYWTMKILNVQGAHPVEEWYNASLNNITNGESKEAGKELGKKAAEAIIAKRAGDNFVQANLQLPLPDGTLPGQYVSTLPFSNEGMPKIKALHQWGTLMRPFVTQSNSQFRPTAPHPVQSSAYTTEYNEVKTKGGRENHNRTAEEDEIGKFWVERSTVGWNRFARNIILSKKVDAWKTARLFALLHTAMTDGVSGCFEAKYHYSYWRPESAIRRGDVDGNPETAGDPGWLPSYLEIPNVINPALNAYTPPIAEYPSAHAAFGGAAAEILKMFLGTDYISVDQTSPTTPGVNRYYTSLDKAARDNSLSRIYVGYHFRLACLKGEEQGKQIAAFVYNNSFQPAD
jgi:hypothetical protein